MYHFKKLIFLVSFLSVCCVGVSQTVVEEKKFKNGNIQEERVFENQKLKIVTNYYKDGSLKTREYIDVRNIYAQNQNIYSDIMGNRQEQIQQAADEVIRAEEHLRRIRGY